MRYLGYLVSMHLLLILFLLCLLFGRTAVSGQSAGRPPSSLLLFAKGGESQNTGNKVIGVREALFSEGSEQYGA